MPKRYGVDKGRGLSWSYWQCSLCDLMYKTKDLAIRHEEKAHGRTKHSRVDHVTVKGKKAKENFVDYLEGTLIPDLKESGRTATAEDFETAVRYIKEK